MLDELNEYVSEEKANEINSTIKEAIRKVAGMTTSTTTQSFVIRLGMTVNEKVDRLLVYRVAEAAKK